MLVNPSPPNPNTPNFKANVIFSERLYSQLPLRQMLREQKYVGAPWLVEDSKMLDEGFSDRAEVCLMSFFKPQGEPKGFFSHCIPFANPIEDVIAVLYPIVQEFKKLGKPIEGILVGAKFQNPTSMERAYDWMKLFDDWGIQYSAFIGQKPFMLKSLGIMKTSPEVDLFVSASKNKYMLDFGSGPAPRNMEDLEERFEIIKRATQDKFIFE